MMNVNLNKVVPTAFSLKQNYPNPFNPSTEISFSLPTTSHVKLEVLNIMGQVVKTIVDRAMPAGTHTVIWNGESSTGEVVGSGVYFYRIEAGNYVDAKKMLLMK
jgi:flagellar hook assembly protein FlgD